MIEWYPGKSLTANTKRKKVAERAVVLSAKNKEPMTESEEESFSFFNFFRPLEVLSADHPDDEGALAFLKDIEWSMVDTESFKIDFFFEKSNPFFSNPVLTKTYYYLLRHEILLGTEG
nr:nucleosome assembly protein 1;3-like [Ipomoea batatas]